MVKEYLGNKCYLCNVNYSTSTAIAVHSEMQSHKCEFCEVTFGQFMDTMRHHMMNNHSLLNKDGIPSEK